MSRRKATGFLLAGLNTLACSYFGNYVFFLLQQQYGFGNRENLLTCALHGLLYVPAAWLGGRFAERRGLTTSLKVGFAGMAAAMLVGGLLHSLTGVFLTLFGWTIAMCFTWPALEACVTAEALNHYPAIAAITCFAARGQHEEVVRGVDLARTFPTSIPAFNAALTWRRGHALRALGRAADCRAELQAARDVLAESELQGPRELLGCLVTEALLLHETDPAQAARILGSVEGHRTTNLGRWVLPHSTDRDADRLQALLLPDQQAAYEKGLAITPQDYVRTTPL